ncbi:uncharacterized protein G2W53_044883 [Senna tora]|nr:uncharacterized protein G2W53_045235 [Senna tora]KAF7800450.1 uncharacterized protein G2W53_045133 [Senna tora]KAF7800530.1 uncharacterized protein G2W53_045053 [Senna tora]KAF7800653.1 uncharacterized protein G2W53_044896 [Senna tora]KAF7801165.1 uncharacterized protein G2W53_044883 [Senna tora]
METSSGDNRATQGMYFQGTTIYICTPPILTKLDTTRLGRIGVVTGEWSSDEANTSRMDNISKGRAVSIKWQPIAATTANSREASPSIPIIPQRISPHDWIAF